MTETRPPYFSMEACQSKHLANYSISYHITEPLKPKPVIRNKTKISNVKSKLILRISRVNTQSHIYMYVH